MTDRIYGCRCGWAYETADDLQGHISVNNTSHALAWGPRGPVNPDLRTLPGHPVKDGAGYDCCCGACLSLPARKAER